MHICLPAYAGSLGASCSFSQHLNLETINLPSIVLWLSFVHLPNLGRAHDGRGSDFAWRLQEVMNQFDRGSVKLIVPRPRLISVRSPLWTRSIFWPRWVKPQPHTAVHEKADGGLVKADLQKQNPSISPQRCCSGRLCAGRDVAAARNNTFFMASPPWHFSAHTHVSVAHLETVERRQRCNVLTQQLLIICSPRWNLFFSKSFYFLPLVHFDWRSSHMLTMCRWEKWFPPPFFFSHCHTVSDKNTA